MCRISFNVDIILIVIITMTIIIIIIGPFFSAALYENRCLTLITCKTIPQKRNAAFKRAHVEPFQKLPVYRSPTLTLIPKCFVPTTAGLRS